MISQGLKPIFDIKTLSIMGIFEVITKIPKILKNNQGAIKFTHIGYDYPEDKILPEFVYVPKAFDIALFPSSLFHQTIPFSSQEERHVVAFDLIPK